MTKIGFVDSIAEVPASDEGLKTELQKGPISIGLSATAWSSY